MYDWGVWIVSRDGCVVEVVGSRAEANLVADMLQQVGATNRIEFIEVLCGPVYGDS